MAEAAHPVESAGMALHQFEDAVGIQHLGLLAAQVGDVVGVEGAVTDRGPLQQTFGVGHGEPGQGLNEAFLLAGIQVDFGPGGRQVFDEAAHHGRHLVTTGGPQGPGHCDALQFGGHLQPGCGQDDRLAGLGPLGGILDGPQRHRVLERMVGIGEHEDACAGEVCDECQRPAGVGGAIHRALTVAGQAGGGRPHPDGQAEVRGGAAQHAQEALLVPGRNQ